MDAQLAEVTFSQQSLSASCAYLDFRLKGRKVIKGTRLSAVSVSMKGCIGATKPSWVTFREKYVGLIRKVAAIAQDFDTLLRKFMRKRLSPRTTTRKFLLLSGNGAILSF